jgi:ferredoxin-thioredoxin reductase catalytic chain
MRSIKEIETEIAAEAKETGYMLNPDDDIREGIIEGLVINEDRLGYWNCPCRRASGNRMADFDIICPCEYRDADLKEYGRCYCALYVTQDYIDKGLPSDPIPERRPAKKLNEDAKSSDVDESQKETEKRIKVWRCQVCGYLCARPEPPSICPICRAKKERFESFDFV